MRACIRAKHPNVVQTYRIWVQGAGMGNPQSVEAPADGERTYGPPCFFNYVIVLLSCTFIGQIQSAST